MTFETLALKTAEHLGYSLYDMEEKGSLLRVYIDKPEGIKISDCMLFDKEYTKVLLEAELLTENLILEVSSPGIYRKLKTLDHFENALKQNIKLTTKDQKTFIDVLNKVEKDFILIGEEKISFEDITKAQVVEGKKK